MSKPDELPDPYEFEKWNAWDEVPPELRTVVSETLLYQAEQHRGAELLRARQGRPGMSSYQALWARVYRLAAEQLRRDGEPH